jgi:RHS repeat-associated protein
MPAFPHKTVLCRYRYDPLDRLADCTPYELAGIQRFYCKSRLATEIQGVVQTSVFQYDDQLLAQQQCQDDQVDTSLLATDQQRSVLHTLSPAQRQPIAYSPYGHRPPENGLLSLLGFNGERPDPGTGHYYLGNGYRAFNPVLMRFNSPDSWSPFGEGGLNAYGYCGGDPRNRVDPTGHIGVVMITALSKQPNVLLKGLRTTEKTVSGSTKTVLTTIAEAPELSMNAANKALPVVTENSTKVIAGARGTTRPIKSRPPLSDRPDELFVKSLDHAVKNEKPFINAAADPISSPIASTNPPKRTRSRNTTTFGGSAKNNAELIQMKIANEKVRKSQ